MACDLCSHLQVGRWRLAGPHGPHAQLSDSSPGRGQGQPSPRPPWVEASCSSSYPRPPVSLVLRSRLWETPGPGRKPGPAPDPSEPQPRHAASGPLGLFCLVNSCGWVAAPGLDWPPGGSRLWVGSLATTVQANPCPESPGFWPRSPCKGWSQAGGPAAAQSCLPRRCGYP